MSMNEIMVLDLKLEIKSTKDRLAFLCKEGQNQSVEFSDTVVALLALQDSLIYCLSKSEKKAA